MTRQTACRLNMGRPGYIQTLKASKFWADRHTYIHTNTQTCGAFQRTWGGVDVGLGLCLSSADGEGGGARGQDGEGRMSRPALVILSIGGNILLVGKGEADEHRNCILNKAHHDL